MLLPERMGQGRCPQCGYRHPSIEYDNVTREECFSCPACGRHAGWAALDEMLLRGGEEFRATTGVFSAPDDTGDIILAHYEQTGFGVIAIQWAGGRMTTHAFPRPLTDLEVARLRRTLETDRRIDASKSFLTRWNGLALEILHGALLPMLAEYEATMVPHREEHPETDSDQWEDSAWEALTESILASLRDANGEQ